MTFITAFESSPDGLFKFRSYRTADDRDRVKQLLTGRAYFSTLSEFNDPFEGRAIFTIGEEATFETRFQSYLARIAAARNLQNVAPRNDIRPMEFVRYITDGHQHRMRNDHRVYCLCARKDHPLIWSHYADSHRGICIQFLANGHPFGHALKVNYDASFPELEAVPLDVRDQEEIFNKSLLTKAPYWEYEQEYRLISVRDEENPTWHLDCPWSADQKMLHFNPKCINGIILGAEMDGESEQDIRDFLASYRADVKIERARLSKNRYGIEFGAI